MSKARKKFPYPRRRFLRGLSRWLGRIILPIFFRIEFRGMENFPRKGPVLVVANHVAVMEAVLMTVYTPWQVELIGGSDIPNEFFIGIIIRSYGFIPVRRGRMERSALKHAVDVLNQEGVIGLFPEGGTWNIGRMRPQTGVAWLSNQGNAPVVPIGFGGLQGALGAAARFKRPRLVMNVGKPLPPADIPVGTAKKNALESYSQQVINAIHQLVPEEERRQVTIENERFELEATVGHNGSGWENPPAELRIDHPSGLSRFLHNGVILKVYQKNLNRDVTALQEIAHTQDPAEIAAAADRVLDYLENENPYLLTYRFGGPEADNMRKGVEELRELARWAEKTDHNLKIVPIRKYYSLIEQREVVQTEQERFENWM